VQIVEIPKDMAKYYPATYYSFHEHGRFKTFLRHQWSAYGFGRVNLLGWFLSHLTFPNYAIRSVARASVPKTSRILDVGCGSGHLLLDLSHLGFTSLEGADPFIAKDIVYQNGVKVLKRGLAEISGEFDVVCLHHSYEHMDQPAEVIQHIHRLLSPVGLAIIRIPVASSYAWRHYGVDWFNLDAPRHFYLHTYKSMELLANGAGLEITKIDQEGEGASFSYSEDYRNNITCNDARFVASNRLRQILMWKRIREWNTQAAELRRKKDSDLVCFFLRRK
jgi:SAM-dependent methyltransferase